MCPGNLLGLQHPVASCYAAACATLECVWLVDDAVTAVPHRHHSVMIHYVILIMDIRVIYLQCTIHIHQEFDFMNFKCA